MDPAIAKAQTPLPPMPALQSLNRSIAFNDRPPGQDLAWEVPLGFRWSEQWFLYFSLTAANTRPPNSSFWALNNGYALADLHVCVFSTRTEASESTQLAELKLSGMVLLAACGWIMHSRKHAGSPLEQTI
jgi:hypothetical protein